jgi:hypothetical protein
MSKQPCVHLVFCIRQKYFEKTDCLYCPQYLPSLLPVLKRLLKFYESAVGKCYFMLTEQMVWRGKHRAITEVISHLEKREAKNAANL